MVAIPDSITEASSSSLDVSHIPSASVSSKTDMKTKSHFVISSPVMKETSSLSALTQQLTTQSTIYRRHEARLARSYALRDDPRPAFIRVLSGLPGFRMIIPPYQLRSQKSLGKLDRRKQKEDFHPTIISPDVYSEETIFVRYPDAADNAVGPTVIGNSESANLYTKATEIECLVQAMLATGFCSGAAEYVFSSTNNARARRSESARNSPFSQANMKASMTTKMNSTIQDSRLFFHHKGSTAPDISGSEIYQQSAREIPNSSNNKSLLKTAKKTTPSNIAFSKAMYTAFPISLLFGTRTLLDSSLSENSQSITSDILSSAIAGGVVGLGRLVLSKFKRQQQPSQPSSLSMMLQQQHFAGGHASSIIGRNAVAAIFYFSIYDVVSSISLKAQSFATNPDTNATFSNNKKGTLNIVAGGALAGVAYAVATNYHRYSRYGSIIWWRRIMFPAASRAAPIHAFVFFGYEKMKEGVETA